MSAKLVSWLVFLLAIACGFAGLYVASQTVMPMVARGTGPSGVTVTPGGWITLVSTLLGSGVLAYISKLIPKAEPFLTMLGPALLNVLKLFSGQQTDQPIFPLPQPKPEVDLKKPDPSSKSELALLSELYSKVKDPLVKKSIRDLAQPYKMAEFDAEFPPVTGGAA